MNLETYVPEIRHPLIGGKHVTVAPLKVRQIPSFTRAIAPVMVHLSSGDMVTAVAVAGDELIRAVAIATDESVEWLGELEADDFIRLASEVLEVNADFFVHRLTPAISRASGSLTRILGATPSPSSCQADSPGATAST